jgi:hypothetical protein
MKSFRKRKNMIEHDTMKCHCNFDFSAKQIECPLCRLSNLIDAHISQVLKGIIRNYYSSYIFEIDDEIKMSYDAIGFSFRQVIKHNRSVITEPKEQNFKDFYLSLACHIEAAFYDIETFIKNNNIHPELPGKNKTLYGRFEYDYVHFPIKARFKNIVRLIINMANVIKHQSGVIYRSEKPNHKAGEILIDEYGLIENKLAYSQTTKIKKTTFNIHNYYEIGCAVYVFLKDLAYFLSNSKELKQNKFDLIQITNTLVDIQLRKNISDVLLNNIHNEAVFIWPQYFASKKSDIFNHVKNRLTLLIELYKKNFKNVLQFELYGNCNIESKKIKKLVTNLNHTGSCSVENRRKKWKASSLKEKKKFYERVILKMGELYGEDFVKAVIFNDFHQLKQEALSKFIIDFYKLIIREGENNMLLFLEVFGFFYFRRWNPFLFGIK